MDGYKRVSKLARTHRYIMIHRYIFKNVTFTEFFLQEFRVVWGLDPVPGTISASYYLACESCRDVVIRPSLLFTSSPLSVFSFGNINVTLQH